MIKELKTWRKRQGYRTLYQQLSGLDARVLADCGLKQDDLETLRRGHSPWSDDDSVS